MACCRNCFCCKCCCREAETRTPEELTILGEFQSEDEILPRKDYESLDYDRCINEPYVEVLEGITNEKARKYEAVRWLMVFAIGVTVGLVGVFVDFFVQIFTKLKLSVVGDSVERCSDKGCLVLSLLQLLAFNLTFVLLASVLVLLEPVSAGSGIPEIKSYLNGVKIPGIVRLRTFLCKVGGVLFSVAGGLFVGKEGPMIHSGAIVGAGLPQFQSITFKWIKMDFPYFRSDRCDKRDFVSAGAAAGVAAAFGAPIGGTLFSLEEGSSFWNQALTWKVLFRSMSATFTLNFFRSGIYFNKWGSFQLPSLLNFGEFKCAAGDKQCHLWTAVDLAFFVLMGVVGGLLGALFNCMNKCLAKYRMKHIHPKARAVRVLESLLVSMVTSLLIFACSVLVGECLELHTSQGNTTGSDTTNSSVRQYFCPNNTYNDMATLLFNPQEKAIHQLFHQDGSCTGRLLWDLRSDWCSGLPGGRGQDDHQPDCHPIESTNEITYGLPIMITLMVAKWTGDLFNKGIYDIHIELRGVPLLEWETEVEMDKLTASDIMEPNLTYVYPHTRVQSLVSILRTTVYHAFPVVTENRHNQRDFSKANILVSNNIHFKGLQCGGGRKILTTLSEQDTPAVPKPVPGPVSQRGVEHGGAFRPLTFHGTVLRSQLVSLLLRGACYSENQSSSTQPRLSYAEMTEDYPRFPDIHDVDLTQLNPRMIVVRRDPYMNPGPYTVSPNSRISQVFNLFRTMGLRHLPVVNAVESVNSFFSPVDCWDHHQTQPDSRVSKNQASTALHHHLTPCSCSCSCPEEDCSCPHTRDTCSRELEDVCRSSQRTCLGGNQRTCLGGNQRTLSRPTAGLNTLSSSSVTSYAGLNTLSSSSVTSYSRFKHSVLLQLSRPTAGLNTLSSSSVTSYVSRPTAGLNTLSSSSVTSYSRFKHSVLLQLSRPTAGLNTLSSSSVTSYGRFKHSVLLQCHVLQQV
ncbi:hypothetical protein WMY93_027600 [Mugilogobius chulae]|uniref:Chloride channel protein n=1 Tax=Mugilogobius chulae TaxID=88201 RepID=A0AAW0MZ80_9GOBI